MSSSTTIQRPLRILSFDGGGVRGLSSLIILRGLMERLALKKGITIRPSDCFDLIIGTGTGGISALLLGRMRMTIDDAIEAYMRIAKAAFEPTASNPFAVRIWKDTSTLDGRALEHVIGDIVRNVLDGHDFRMEDPTNDLRSCRTAILAVTSVYIDAPPYVFRSYSGRQPASQFSITSVARATVSTANVFKPVSLGSPPVQFIDAGVSGYNNPVEVGLAEAAELWPGRDIDCVVSLGTGLQQIVGIGEGWNQVAEACMSILQSCQIVHDRVYRMRQHSKLPYFRFNVGQGLVDVAEWKETGSDGNIAGITEAYMRWAEVSNHLDTCVSVLNEEILAPMQSRFSNSQQRSKFLPLHHPAPEVFHGRESYIDLAVAMLLQEKGARLAILGPGGIGKTSIACAILHDSRVESKFSDQRYFISCEGISSITLLVDTLCAAFDLQDLSTDQQNDLLMFLSHTYSTQTLLLILDNFETVWETSASEVEKLLAALVQTAQISLVMTMRGSERPAGLSWTKPLMPIVEQLDSKAAHDTFIDICEKMDGELDELLQELDYIPLAVTLMAHLGQVEQPSDLLRRWRKEHTKLLSQSQDQGRLKNVDISISISIESHRMQSCPEALVLLSVISLLPGGVTDGVLPAITPNIKACEYAVTTLCRVGLAYYDHMKNLCVLSPVRSYVLENHPPDQMLVHDLETFYFQWVHRVVGMLGSQGDCDDKRALQSSEANMEAILLQAMQKEKIDDINFITTIQAALDWTDFLLWTSPRYKIIKLAITMTQGKYGQHVQYAQCLRRLGEMQYKRHSFDEAQNTLSMAQMKLEAIEDHLGAALCLQILGDIQRLCSNYEQAQEILVVAQARLNAIGKQIEVAQCLQSLGDIQRMLHNYKPAQAMLLTAQAKFEAIGNQLGAARCLRSLGSIQCVLHNYGQAEVLLFAGRAKFEAIYDQLGVAQCTRRLGDIQYMLHNYEQSQKILSPVLAKFKVLGNRLGAAQCLRSLGVIQHCLQNYEGAYKMLSEAKDSFEAIGNKLGAALCLQYLGDVQCMLQNYEKAQDTFSEAHTKFEAIQNRVGVAECLKGLGNIYYLLKQNEQAQSLLSMAQALFKATEDRLGAAQCLKICGNAAFANRNFNKAEELIIEAQGTFQQLGIWTEAEQQECSKILALIPS